MFICLCGWQGAHAFHSTLMWSPFRWVWKIELGSPGLHIEHLHLLNHLPWHKMWNWEVRVEAAWARHGVSRCSVSHDSCLRAARSINVLCVHAGCCDLGQLPFLCFIFLCKKQGDWTPWLLWLASPTHLQSVEPQHSR